jgi:hypothetical protein
MQGLWGTSGAKVRELRWIWQLGKGIHVITGTFGSAPALATGTREGRLSTLQVADHTLTLPSFCPSPIHTSCSLARASTASALPPATLSLQHANPEMALAAERRAGGKEGRKRVPFHRQHRSLAETCSLAALRACGPLGTYVPRAGSCVPGHQGDPRSLPVAASWGPGGRTRHWKSWKPAARDWEFRLQHSWGSPTACSECSNVIM